MGAWLRRIRGRGPLGGCCVTRKYGPWRVLPLSGKYYGTQVDVGLGVITVWTPDHYADPFASKREIADGWTQDIGHDHVEDAASYSIASLIAAAPDLLEALIWMVENDETFEGDTPLPDHHGATWNEINAYWIAGLNRARAAIAKATGEGE